MDVYFPFTMYDTNFHPLIRTWHADLLHCTPLQVPVKMQTPAIRDCLIIPVPDFEFHELGEITRSWSTIVIPILLLKKKNLREVPYLVIFHPPCLEQPIAPLRWGFGGLP